MDIKGLFRKELINIEVVAETKEELFEVVAKDLKKYGFVNDGYLRAITMREQEFPTGLITKYLNVALPHSDTEYVDKPFIYVARLKNDFLTFKQMGDNQELKVRDFFFLGIKDASKQVNLLSYLMDLFTDEDFMTEYHEADRNEKIYNIINKFIQKR